MMRPDGQSQNNRQSTADMFATLYVQLYQDPRQKQHQHKRQQLPHNSDDPITLLTVKELDKAIDRFNDGNAADSNRIVAFL